MLNLYLYLILQLLIFVFIYYGFNMCATYAPQKIKILSFVVLASLLVRNISLLVLFLWENMVNLYLLKPFVFLNLIGIPLAAVICLYIFIRNDKINFSYSFLIGVFLLAAYTVLMAEVPHGVQSSHKFGYYINLLNPMPVSFSYIALHTAIMITSILQIGKRGTNNLGLYFILLASIVSIVETLLSLIGIELLAHSIIGDVLWILVLDYGIMGFRKRIKI